MPNCEKMSSLVVLPFYQKSDFEIYFHVSENELFSND